MQKAQRRRSFLSLKPSAENLRILLGPLQGCRILFNLVPAYEELSKSAPHGSIQSALAAPGAQIHTHGVSPTTHVSPSWLPLEGNMS